MSLSQTLIAMAGHSESQLGGTLLVRSGENEIGRAEIPEARSSGSLVEISDLGTQLESLVDKDGNVTIELVALGTQNMRYTIDVATHVTKPDSDEKCPVRLTTELSGELDSAGAVADGSLLKVSTRLTNVTQQGQPMTVAIIGLPGGVEPRAEQLDELRDAGQFDYYELRPREVILYWRTIEPAAVKEVDFDVTATVPGRYTGPASRAYLYYTAEQKQWVEPLKVTIGR